jgi:hypothetical protein
MHSGGQTVNKQLLDLWRDLVYAFRILAKSRGFTAVGILSLTLGIGVFSVFYSELNALVFRPLPAARAEEALAALSRFPRYITIVGTTLLVLSGVVLTCADHSRAGLVR